MKRLDAVITLTLFITSLVMYLRTLAPDLLFGDSAEFQTIAYTLGIGHPTGYPVYILLANFFTLIPVGEIAYRVNVFSAFCAALTVALLYLIGRSLGARILSAAFGSLTLALIPLFWKHASIAEIYTLSAACLAFILLAVFQWRQTENPRWLFAAGLAGGLSLGIHTTVALGAIPIIVFLALTTRRRTDWQQAGFGALAGLLVAFASFLFLDLLNSPAGYYNTVVRPSLSVWGMSPSDFDSPFERFAFLYFPPQFKAQFFNVPFLEINSRLSDLTAESSWVFLLGFIGLVSLILPRKDSPSRWREALLLVLAFIIFLAFAVTYNIYDFYVYYIPAIVVLAILVGLGVDAVVDLVASIPMAPRSLPVVLGVLILVLGLYPSLADVSSHWRERTPPGLEDWEEYSFAFPEVRRLEAEQLVNRLEDNAIVFTDWDRAYNYYYAAHVLQGRTGLSFHETYPQEGVTQLADSAIQYIEANIATRPIYFSERPSQLADKYKITRAGSDLYRIEEK